MPPCIAGPVGPALARPAGLADRAGGAGPGHRGRALDAAHRADADGVDAGRHERPRPALSRGAARPAARPPLRAPPLRCASQAPRQAGAPGGTLRTGPRTAHLPDLERLDRGPPVAGEEAHAVYLVARLVVAPQRLAHPAVGEHLDHGAVDEDAQGQGLIQTEGERPPGQRPGLPVVADLVRGLHGEADLTRCPARSAPAPRCGRPPATSRTTSARPESRVNDPARRRAPRSASSSGAGSCPSVPSGRTQHPRQRQHTAPPGGLVGLAGAILLIQPKRTRPPLLVQQRLRGRSTARRLPCPAPGAGTAAPRTRRWPRPSAGARESSTHTPALHGPGSGRSPGTRRGPRGPRTAGAGTPSG